MPKFNLARGVGKARQLKGFAAGRAAQQRLGELMNQTPEQAWSMLSDAERKSYGSSKNFNFTGRTREQAFSMLSQGERDAINNMPKTKFGNRFTPGAKSGGSAGASAEAAASNPVAASTSRINTEGLSREQRVAQAQYLRNLRSGGLQDAKGMDRLKGLGYFAKGNLDSAVQDGGFSSAWSMAGHHAIRGAIGGAAIGGTMSALNGGDFWDGAKEGAFKGAVGYTGMRMGMAATGATSMNPFAGGGKGMLSSGYNMWGATGGKNVKFSKAAAKILAQRQGDGFARGVMYANQK